MCGGMNSVLFWHDNIMYTEKLDEFCEEDPPVNKLYLKPCEELMCPRSNWILINSETFRFVTMRWPEIATYVRICKRGSVKGGLAGQLFNGSSLVSKASVWEKPGELSVAAMSRTWWISRQCSCAFSHSMFTYTASEWGYLPENFLKCRVSAQFVEVEE